jgi:hypothetical protein
MADFEPKRVDLRRLTPEQRRKYKQKLIADWRQSGMNQACYCRKFAINERSFSKWKVEVQVDTSMSGFAEVRSRMGEDKGKPIHIRFQDIEIRVEIPVDMLEIKKVLQAVKDICF